MKTNRVLAGILFSALLLGIVGLDNAFAATIEITDEVSCFAAGAGNYFETTAADGCFFDSLTVNADDTLIVENAFLTLGTGGLTNLGNIIMVGGEELNSATIVPSQGGAVLNECGATITLEGSNGINSAKLVLDDGDSFTNLGTLNLNGGDGQNSGSFTISSGATGNNHGTINENPGSGSFSGIVRLVGTGVFNDNLPNNCPSEIVGGELLPIDSTALMLAGLQTSAIWMLPVLAGVAGSAFGVLYIKSRRN